MSYAIEKNGAVIWTPAAAAADGRFGLSAAALQEEENKIPKLTFTLPAGHPYRGGFTPMKDTVRLTDGTELLFTGRPTLGKEDFWGSLAVTCEGALGYLQDLPDVYTTASEDEPVAVQTAFAALLAGYAADADAGRKIYAGACDVAGSVAKAGEGQVWDTISGWVQSFGGYLFLRETDGRLYLDYKAARPAADATQAIRFGVNLLETLDRSTDATKVVTGVLAIGGTPEGAAGPVTLTGYTDAENGIRFAATRAYYGSIVKRIVFSEALTQAALWQAAGDWLAENQAAAISLKLAALENKLLGLAPAHMRVGVPYPVISQPHGVDTVLPLVKRTLNVLTPDASTTELGATAKALTARHAGWAKQAAAAAAASQTALSAAVQAQATAASAVPSARTVNGHALSTDVMLAQGDLGAADYVAETGETDGWSWRKWASGLRECRRVAEIAIPAGGYTAWGSVFAYSTTATYPANFFTAAPSLSVSPCGGSGCWTGMLRPSEHTAARAAISVLRAANTTAATTVRVALHAYAQEANT